MKIFYYLRHILLLLAALAALSAMALPETFYAPSSKLAEGRWATVRVSETGMHLISDATLRSLGFTDPSRVRVYGIGGPLLSEKLNSSMSDDLPLVPSVRTSRGIVFFGRNHVSWAPGSSSSRPYEHETHYFSEANYYFLSDRDLPDEIPVADMSQGNGAEVTSFTARLLHERELAHLGESGRTYLGEDFRTTRAQTFSFPLPGNVGKEVRVVSRFAAKVSSGSSVISMKANGNAAPGARGDSIASCPSGSYANLSLASRRIPVEGEKLDLTVEYANSGVLFLARLDYVEAFYTRRLALQNGELHFYGNFKAGSTLRLDGCSDKTRIWDMSDPVRPRSVTFRRDGESALLSIPSSGNYEFVAFNPDQVARAAAIGSRVANQDIHAMKAPGMLIISPSEYREGAGIIAAIHDKVDTLDVAILEPAMIYNEFSGGKADVTAFRRLLKMWHDRGGAPRYVLIMGKPSYDYKGTTPEVLRDGCTPSPIWQSLAGLSESSSFSTDDYIAMLDETDPGSEFSMARARIYAAIGRLPVKNSREAREVAEKISRHALSPSYGSWRNKVMLVADDADNNSHFNQAQKSYDNYRAAGNGRSYIYDRLYLDSYPLVSTPVGPSYPQATEKFLANLNEGVALTNYIGHGSATSLCHEHLWSWEQITSMANKNLTFFYAATCRFCPWDEAGVSAGEHLMLNTDGGIWGMIAASRTVYISPNGILNNYMAREWFRTGADGLPRRLGDIYIEGKNAYSFDDNKLRYFFMGDPALRMNAVSRRVVVDEINGADPEAGEGFPEIPAGSRMTLAGRVCNPDGSEASDFDGTVTVQLYDAETVVETFGNGENGIATVYNDRKTRLASVNAPAVKGRWKAVMTVPLETSNNYAQALLSLYASDGKGLEGNGYSESLYVFGYSDDAPADTVGPLIEYFRLNTEAFENGGVVNPNPMVFARVSDPSGINIADNGIGHKLSLRLDSEAPYTNVGEFFTADADGTPAGIIAYPLSDLAPGSHKLCLEVWDNYNNSSRDTIEFRVHAAADPYIVKLGTDVNPATSGVNFILSLDIPNTMIDCRITVYDLSGKAVWESSDRRRTDSGATLTTHWDLCDKSGVRVPRGIYLYKAHVRTPQGTWASKTNKLAVTAQ